MVLELLHGIDQLVHLGLCECLTLQIIIHQILCRRRDEVRNQRIHLLLSIEVCDGSGDGCVHLTGGAICRQCGVDGRAGLCAGVVPTQIDGGRSYLFPTVRGSALIGRGDGDKLILYVLGLRVGARHEIDFIHRLSGCRRQLCHTLIGELLHGCDESIDFALRECLTLQVVIHEIVHR